MAESINGWLDGNDGAPPPLSPVLKQLPGFSSVFCLLDDIIRLALSDVELLGWPLEAASLVGREFFEKEAGISLKEFSEEEVAAAIDGGEGELVLVRLIVSPFGPVFEETMLLFLRGDSSREESELLKKNKTHFT